MKSLIKSTIAVAILMLSIATLGIGQEKDTLSVRNIYKVSLSKLLAKQYFLGYERIVSDRFSLNAQAGLLREAFYLESFKTYNNVYGIKSENSLGDWDFSRRAPTKFGYQINLETRYYLSGFEKNWFVGVRGGYQYANFGEDLRVNLYAIRSELNIARKFINAKQNSYFYGITIGANFILEGLALESYLLVGRRHSELIDPIGFVPDPDFPVLHFEEFNINHLNSVDRMHFEFGFYIGIGR